MADKPKTPAPQAPTDVMYRPKGGVRRTTPPIIRLPLPGEEADDGSATA